MISHNLPTKSAGGSDLASDQILRHRDEIIIRQFPVVVSGELHDKQNDLKRHSAIEMLKERKKKIAHENSRRLFSTKKAPVFSESGLVPGGAKLSTSANVGHHIAPVLLLLA